ncbi:MAG: MMPL family transporter [Gammaproteobacteria bacterium]|nr:MMPL family transporter [Gammaproteobacteria bacterium]
MIKALYKKLILDLAPWTVITIGVFVASLGYFAKDFKLDASEDSLILENDKALSFYRSVRARYGSDENLIITYRPNGDMFDPNTLNKIANLRRDLLALDAVDSITSIVDVPLIRSPKVGLSEVQEKTITLSSEEVDLQLARQEFANSPLYQNLIISPDGKTTAMEVALKQDPTYQALGEKRDGLREKQFLGQLTEAEESELAIVSESYKRYGPIVIEQEQAAIEAVRQVLDNYRGDATIFLGGIPMIVSDMISYIANDISVFGVAVLLIIIVLLRYLFQKNRWIILPTLVCGSATLAMVGLLGLMEWKVTVVSSNFISLLLIITLSLTVHLIVRYLELRNIDPDQAVRELVWDAVKSKFQPAFYTAITTMVAFGSLIVSGIRPVIDFGWMMFFGVFLAFILAFFMFPSALMFFKPGPLVQQRETTERITNLFARTIKASPNGVIIVSLSVLALSLWGISKLTVENRFIDYFKETSEIYQGMITIDQQLGGTTPMDVIINPDQNFFDYMNEMSEEEKEELADVGMTGSSYWFNVFELEKVEKIHQYLESLPETGKVLSIATTIKLLTQLNNDKPLDNITLGVIYNRLPENLKSSLVSPYLSDDGNQIRFGIRVFESDSNLRRQQLIEKINRDLQEQFELAPEQIQVSGMVVLYNNLLRSLFESQIMTIGVVFLAIMLMFFVLFRSFKLSVIAIIPNIIAALFVLGIMGWLGIHLDIMTITIAAIVIGIAVDNSIHYIHRFKEEFPVDKDYWAAVTRCHNSIGKAIYYTTVIVALGFSVLAFSSFIPTIYFGLLTGAAMIVALVANMTLLPVLLVKLRALG